MKGKRKKLSRAVISSIIFAAACVLAAAAVIITNLFIPVKYFGSYVFAGSDELEASGDVTFLDVDYGTCIIVRFPDGKVMLIDGGDGGYTHRCKIIKNLNAMDVDYIDWLVCSSVNEEHCGGLAEIVKYKEVGVIYYPYCTNTYITDEYRSFYLAALDSGAEMRIYEYGEGCSGDGYFFSFLSPGVRTNPSGEYASLNSDPTSDNKKAASAVLWVECNGTSFLFCSDATSDVMTKICENYLLLTSAGDSFARQGKYSVVLEELDVAEGADHGGSASATFYAYAQPDYTIVSVGTNTSGKPLQTAFSTYTNYSAAYTTWEQGDIRINVTEDGYTIFD